MCKLQYSNFKSVTLVGVLAFTYGNFDANAVPCRQSNKISWRQKNWVWTPLVGYVLPRIIVESKRFVWPNPSINPKSLKGSTRFWSQPYLYRNRNPRACFIVYGKSLQRHAPSTYKFWLSSSLASQSLLGYRGPFPEVRGWGMTCSDRKCSR